MFVVPQILLQISVVDHILDAKWECLINLAEKRLDPPLECTYVYNINPYTIHILQKKKFLKA